MRFRSAALAVALGAASAGSLLADTRLGLVFTADELALWRVRVSANTAPYSDANAAGNLGKFGGISSLASKAGSFDAAITGTHPNHVVPSGQGYYPVGPGGPTWTIPPVLGNVPDDNTQVNPDGNKEMNTKAAAFYSLVHPTPSSRTNLKRKVRAVIMAAVNSPNVDFTNTHANRPYNYLTDQANVHRAYSHHWPFFFWLLNRMQDYEYTSYVDTAAGETSTSVYSAADKTKIDAYFIAAGEYAYQALIKRCTQLWPNRAGEAVEVYSQFNNVYLGNSSYANILGEKEMDSMNRSLDNKVMVYAAFLLGVGIKYDVEEYRAQAKRVFQESLCFGTLGTGASSELHRGAENASSKSEIGYAYSWTQTSVYTIMAEMAARAGDSFYYRYTTAHGYAHPTHTPLDTRGDPANPKSLRKVMDYLLRLNLIAYPGGTPKYCTRDPGQANLLHQIDGKYLDNTTTDTWRSGHYAAPSLVANLFYQDYELNRMGSGAWGTYDNPPINEVGHGSFAKDFLGFGFMPSAWVTYGNRYAAYSPSTNPNPYAVAPSTIGGDTMINEAESLIVGAVSASDRHRLWGSADSAMSQQHGTILEANAVNDHVTFAIPSVGARTYRVYIKTKKTSSRGKFRLGHSTSATGSFTEIATDRDQYSASVTYAEMDLGTITFATAGEKYFRFRVVGKNAASTDYDLAFDYIKLVPQ